MGFVRERCVSGRCGTTRRAADRHSRRTCSDQVVPDTEPAPRTIQQALARTFNPLVVGSSPTGPTGAGEGIPPLTCYAALGSASVGSGAAVFSGSCARSSRTRRGRGPVAEKCAPRSPPKWSMRRAECAPAAPFRVPSSRRGERIRAWRRRTGGSVLSSVCACVCHRWWNF